MRTKQGLWIMGVVAAGLAVALLAGCRVQSDKHGDSDDVKIATPFGGLQVKTNDAVVVEGIGLPTYPGAQLVKKDKDDGSADVNMSFGSFQLRVKAVSYRTGDSPEKVETFYRAGLKRFGDVIACRDNRVVGTPARTQEGLTCDNNRGNHYSVDDKPEKVEAFYRSGLKRFGDVIACRDNRVVGTPAKTLEGLTCDNEVKNHISVDDKPSKGGLELKAGSQQHQHIVEIDAEGGGTKIGLVALDLPGNATSQSGDEQNRQ